MSNQLIDECSGDMLQRLGMDGRLWAQEFNKTCVELDYPQLDEGWLIGWFCNAIMAGYDESSRRWGKRTPTEAELMEAVSALYGCREVLGSVANIQYAIDGLEKYLPKKDSV